MSRPRPGSCPASPPPDPRQAGAGSSPPPPFHVPAVFSCPSCPGRKTPMNASSDRPARADQLRGRLTRRRSRTCSASPPRRSLVVVGATARRAACQAAFRYDLPDPPDAAAAARSPRHAVSVLARHHLTDRCCGRLRPGPAGHPARGCAPRRRSRVPGCGCVTCCASRTAGTGRTCARTRVLPGRGCSVRPGRASGRAGTGRRRAAGAAEPGCAGRHDRPAHRASR